MIKYSFMIGVLPGYEHLNENLDEEKALLWGEEAYKNATNEQGTGSVQLASAIYSKEWGCPEGGELGVSISGTAESKEEVEEVVKKMMLKLDQTTCTIEFEDEQGKSLGSSYIKDKGENVDHNEPLNSEKFSVKIPMDKINMHEMGSRLQDAIVKVGSTEGMYYATGILTRGYDEKAGKEFLMYSGSQNPIFSPDTRAYVESAYDTIRLATEDLGPLAIVFNDKTVLTNEQKATKEVPKDRD